MEEEDEALSSLKQKVHEMKAPIPGGRRSLHVTEKQVDIPRAPKSERDLEKEKQIKMKVHMNN